jgi:UDP-N-acetylmuramyl pentapeptide phosphotransferase/UDP-N-acetylglucosamine-1-phosphate transferase
MVSLFFFILFLLVNFFYIKIWKKFSDKVPSGIGVLLTIPCFFYYFEQNLYFTSIVLILTFSFLYYLDDLKGIHFLSRLFLQTSASLVIYFSYTLEINFITIFLNLIFFIILVNVLNFQDGEDLNISILFVPIFILFYLYSESEIIKNVSKIIVLFLIAFSLFNSKKKTLYFGDSGCFFVSIIIFLFVYNEINNFILIKLLIAVLAFPVTDVFYVISYRIFKKENLLSRNYLHVYQILAQKVNYKVYLVPNILFSVLNILISRNFFLGVKFIFFLVFINILFLFIIRLIIKKLTQQL